MVLLHLQTTSKESEPSNFHQKERKIDNPQTVINLHLSLKPEKKKIKKLIGYYKEQENTKWIYIYLCRSFRYFVWISSNGVEPQTRKKILQKKRKIRNHSNRKHNILEWQSTNIFKIRFLKSCRNHHAFFLICRWMNFPKY